MRKELCSCINYFFNILLLRKPFRKTSAGRSFFNDPIKHFIIFFCKHRFLPFLKIHNRSCSEAFSRCRGSFRFLSMSHFRRFVKSNASFLSSSSGCFIRAMPESFFTPFIAHIPPLLRHSSPVIKVQETFTQIFASISCSRMYPIPAHFSPMAELHSARAVLPSVQGTEAP